MGSQPLEFRKRKTAGHADHLNLPVLCPIKKIWALILYSLFTTVAGHSVVFLFFFVMLMCHTNRSGNLFLASSPMCCGHRQDKRELCHICNCDKGVFASSMLCC